MRVHDDAGNVGIGSGDSMYGFADYQRYFIGEDPLDLDRHAAVLANIDFHAGRPWPLDIALWDLAGKIRDEPVWRMRRWARRTGSRRTPRPASTARWRRWSISPDASSTSDFRR